MGGEAGSEVTTRASARDGVPLHRHRTTGAVRWRTLVGRREFGGIVLARVLSDWGDQIARVALAAHVLTTSRSVLLSAATFAVSYLPSVAGEAVLAPLVDRVPRKALMIFCDVARAVMMTVIVLALAAGAPALALVALLFVVELFTAPFLIAMDTVLIDVLPERREYLAGNGLVRMIGQVNQVVGLAVGGIVVALLHTVTTLWLDVASFVVAGALLGLVMRSRPAPADGGVGGVGVLLRDVRDGARHLARNRAMAALAMLAWGVAVVFSAPEGVSLAYARQHGQGTAVGGLLLASLPAGAAVGVVLLGRWTPTRQVAALLPLAAGTCLPLLPIAVNPPVSVAIALWFCSGLCQAFMVPLLSTYSALAPDAMRGRLNGLGSAVFSGATAAGYLGAGAVADVATPAFAVTLFAALGCLLLAWIWRRWPHAVITRAAGDLYG